MAESIRPFNPDGDDVGHRWNRWVERFKLFLRVKKITNDDDMVDNLLYYGGEVIHEKYLPAKDANHKIDDVIKILSAIFSPPTTTQMSLFKFRKMEQLVGEPFDEYVTRLRGCASFCGFATSDVENQLKNQIIQGCQSDKLRVRALEQDKITFEDLFMLGKTIEAVDTHMKTIKMNMSTACGTNSSYDQVNRINDKRELKDNENRIKSCFRCGGSYPHTRDKGCPAANVKCNLCRKEGHFAKCCKTKPEKMKQMSDREKINMLNDFAHTYEPDQDYDNVWTVKEPNSKLPTIKLEVCNSEVEFTIDTGASVNTIDEHEWSKIVTKPKLYRSSVRLFAYGGSEPLEILGEFRTRANIRGTFYNFLVQVVKGANGNVLGHETLLKMGIIKIIRQINNVKRDSFTVELGKKYPSVFSGKIGKLKNNLIKLHINPEVKPVHQRNRPTGFHLRDGILKAIQTMLDNDIIEKVSGPTPWVSPIVPIIKENGEIRVCTDAKMLNTAIKREVHNMPTVEEIAIELNGAKFISKLDLKSAYNQLELDPDCRDITVFSTHLGLFRYKRLNFGISSAAEIFQ